ncbi:MAG: methyltransferase domain-containing protein [Acidobacteriia bacterium]|nr:methyltransferase domain-containing protein [Terriglobia bacterium]
MANRSPTSENSVPEVPERTYSEELFGRGIYGHHHRRRFEWLRARIGSLLEAKGISVLEVGCHDGRALAYIPRRVRRYVGLDAGWGGGLERARQRFAAEKSYSFIQSTDPRDLASLAETFDIIICMETLEHLETPVVEQYLQAFAEKLDGFLLITVPNEKGIPFLVKAAGARIMGIDRIYPYTAGECFWAALGRLNRIPRTEHKGFDYARLVALIEKRFRHVTVEGVSPFTFPPSLCLTVGIVASQKPRRNS